MFLPGIKFVFTCGVDGSEDGIAGYRKDYYNDTVEKGGGMVYDTIPQNDRANTVLVSSTHSRTYKYFHALLLGL